jgi:predicted kinase
MTEKVYRELVRRGERVLRSRRPVVLDASFRSRAFRERAKELARSRGVPFVFVECRAPEDALRARLREREREQGVSDGRLEIFDEFVARWEPVEELESGEHLVLDTSQPIEETERLLRDRLRVWPRGFTG